MIKEGDQGEEERRDVRECKRGGTREVLVGLSEQRKKGGKEEKEKREAGRVDRWMER